MAINILTEPQDPPVSGDYTLDQAIQHACEVPQLSILTGWETTASAPSAKQGSFLRHAANTFQVQSSDESISGSPVAGINYIIATETSGVIALAWATSLTGYSYNPAYGGIYDSSGNQALRDICYLDGTDYYRGMCFGEDFNAVRLSDGRVMANEIVLTGNIDSDEITCSTIQVASQSTVSGVGYLGKPFHGVYNDAGDLYDDMAAVLDQTLSYNSCNGIIYNQTQNETYVVSHLTYNGTTITFYGLRDLQANTTLSITTGSTDSVRFSLLV